MSIRNQNKISSLGVVPGIRLELNPFAQPTGSARILRNFIPERGRLIRKPFSPNFTHKPDGVTSSVWRIFNYRFTRAGAAENKLIIVRSNGKVYERKPGYEQEISPAHWGLTGGTLVQKPFIGQLGNRLFFSDGRRAARVYDGRTVYTWHALTRVASAPAVSAVAGSLTAATGLKAAITFVHLDEASNRVHESSRSNKSAFQVLAAENLRIDVSGISIPSRATHWSGYVSELNGSEVLRRTNTTAKTTTTFDVSALPAATNPQAPIRNDRPPSSSVGAVAKNRIFLRDDLNPNTFYFSALGEVKGLSNGAPEESFPGNASIYGSASVTSISDLVNSDFIPDREIRNIVSHENLTFLFSERRGFVLQGEMNLLDDRVSRSLVKLEQFQEGCAGPTSSVSTPYGLVFMSPGKKLWLWPSGRELLDIGDPVQRILNTIPGDEIENVALHWWGGRGRQWLLVALHARDSESTDDSTTEANRILIYDFSLPSQRATANQVIDPGSWFEWTDVAATAFGEFTANDGTRFLLAGTTTGDVVQLDTITSPAHLNRSAILGETYLGSTVQNNPAATLRTSLLLPSGDQQVVGQYVSTLTGDQNAPGVPSAGAFTEPTVSSWIDVEDPDSPGTAITLTLGSARASGDKEAWLLPETGGDASGAAAKQFLLQGAYAAGVDSTGQGDGRDTNRVNSIYKFGLTWSPVSEQGRE